MKKVITITGASGGIGSAIALNLRDHKLVLTGRNGVAHTVRYLVEESETANTKLIEQKPRRKKAFR